MIMKENADPKTNHMRPAEAVWDAASGLMYRTAYEILNDPSDAEDAVMDAMCRIVKNEKKFSGLSCNNMRALSVIYVRNTAIDLYRKNRKRPFPLEDFSETAGDFEPFEEEIAAKDEADRISQAIRSLPPAGRDVLLLAGKYGMSAGEIAEILRIDRGTVRTRLSRARAALKEILKKSKNTKNGGDR